MRKPAAPNEQDLTGHLRRVEQGGPLAGGRRPLSTAWITDELIAETRRVWSRHLGRIVTDEEAIEMLVNVRNAALAIMAASGDGADE